MAALLPGTESGILGGMCHWVSELTGLQQPYNSSQSCLGKVVQAICLGYREPRIRKEARKCIKYYVNCASGGEEEVGDISYVNHSSAREVCEEMQMTLWKEGRTDKS